MLKSPGPTSDGVTQPLELTEANKHIDNIKLSNQLFSKP